MSIFTYLLHSLCPLWSFYFEVSESPPAPKPGALAAARGVVAAWRAGPGAAPVGGLKKRGLGGVYGSQKIRGLLYDCCWFMYIFSKLIQIHKGL